MKTEYAVAESDLPLIQRAMKGHQESFEALFEPFRDHLLRQALRKLRNHDDARDAVQETAVRAWRGLRTFRPDQPMRPWLQRICRNVCVDAIRSRKGDAEELGDREETLRDPGADLCRLAETSELSDQIRRAIGRLPLTYRRVVRMRHLEEMEVLEIAERLQKPEGTIKSWLFRARELLRKELEPLALGA
jgi:RNA polymerase sigma-70 factor (ECF subfamily)